ncbi:ABC transporter permease [Massilia sp. DWR3-1-1]|uniref:ABC transporter permease n=1 Tax=Massilia sp. DWR3-1-1 TaxID=2804559 RepID=UPI003CEA7168
MSGRTKPYQWWTLLRTFASGARANLRLYLVLMAGVGVSVFVLCWLLALRDGFARTLAQTGHGDQLVVLRHGASSESTSYIAPLEAAALQNDPLVQRGAGGAMASAEFYSVNNLDAAAGAPPISVGVRGVGPMGAPLRPAFRLVAGAMFAPGTREIVVGKAIAPRLAHGGVGDQLAIQGVAWKIAGVFASGDVHESEIWADAAVVQNTLRLGGYQSILLRIDGDGARAAYRARIARDASLHATALPEPEYYARNGSQFPRIIGHITSLIGLVMLAGACMNTYNFMAFLADLRRFQIGVLRAIGYSPGAITCAVLIEGLTLTGAGALLGWLCAWLVFDGRSANTINQDALTQVVFAYTVNLRHASIAVGMALLAALIGGSVSAARVAGATVRQLLLSR